MIKVDKMCNKRGFAGKIFWSLVFIIIGLSLLLQSIGVVDIQIALWQMVAGALLAVVAVRNLVRFEWFGFFLPLALIVTIFERETQSFLGVENIKLWSIWAAAVLLAIGLSLILKQRHVYSAGYTQFGASTRHFKASELKNVNVECNFGSTKIYVEDGTPPENASIDLSVSFGGIMLYVPRDWQIVDDIKKSLGGVSEKNMPSREKKTKTLRLTGSLNFGGVEINYV
jgi:hypothetical protein